MTQTELTPTASLIGKWKPYSDYKDLGVEWLGEIPAHWEVKRLKFFAHINMGQSPDSNDYNLNNLGIPFLQGNAEFGHIHPEPRIWCETARKFANPIDILLSVRAPVGQMNISDQIYGIGRGLCAITGQRQIDRNYLWFLLQVIREELACISTGSTYDAVSVNEVKRLVGLVPPLTEQHAIASFLDCETARINALIAKKEQLIELLQEKRAALISHAVTKGLDPTVPMKKSSVEWLGEIPAHWEVAPVYSRYTVQLGKMLNQEAVKGFSPAPYLRNVNIQWDYVDLSDILEMDFNPYERQKYNLIFGDLLVCEGGEVGRTALWRGELTECYFQKAIHRVRPFSTQEDGRFLFYILNAAANLGVFKAEGNKSTIVHLTAEKLKKHRFAFPSLAEQRSIISFLNHETAKIDALISRIREGIEKLKEYSSALISAAVTGKIDVRGEISMQGSEM